MSAYSDAIEFAIDMAETLITDPEFSDEYVDAFMFFYIYKIQNQWIENLSGTILECRQ